MATAFAHAAELGAVAAGDLGHEMLEHGAGLVVAHRRMAAVDANWEDVVLTWEPGDSVPVLSKISDGARRCLSAGNDALHHMRAIDLAAQRSAGAPGFGAVQHHRGMGAVFARLAYLYTISFDGFVLDGPQGENRILLACAYAAYENLAADLAAGRRYLPDPFRRPDE